jgi:hypothetical protein
MAANSLREQIILADISLIEALSNVKTVVRTVQSYSDLSNFAGPQLPVAAVVGRLPVPANHIRTRDGQVDQILSELKVDVYFYFQENVNADLEISDYLDDLWVALYADPTRGGLCLYTELLAVENYETWAPYTAFQMVINHRYKHNTGGI